MSKKEFNSIAEFLSGSTDSKEVYLTDQKKRLKRKNRGYYSRQNGCFDFIQLINSWEDIVGALLAKNSIPRKIHNGTLYIITKHPVFTQELTMMGPEIIKKISEHIPYLKDRLKKVKFTNADFSFEEFQKDKSSDDNNEKLSAANHPFSPHFKAKQQKANAMFDDIEDPELKEILIHLFINKF